MRRVPLLSLLALIAFPGQAAAAPTPQAPTMSIHLQRLIVPGLALNGTPFRVAGTVRPYVAGQRVVVRVYRHKRVVRVDRRLILPVPGSDSGTFSAHMASNASGRLTVRASHSGTPELATVVAVRRHVTILPKSASFGSRGPLVKLLQRGLAKLGYAVSQSSVYDAATGRAVLAYRKVNGLSRVETPSPDIVRRVLQGKGTFHARYPSHGRHVEADLSRQVLVELDGSKPYRIYILSSGKPSTPTVLGTFSVYSKAPGTNAKGMFDSNYFHGGYAIHGYPEVPVYAASHGCLRVPNPDAPSIFGWVHFGTVVDVYYP